MPKPLRFFPHQTEEFQFDNALNRSASYRFFIVRFRNSFAQRKRTKSYEMMTVRDMMKNAERAQHVELIKNS